MPEYRSTEVRNYQSSEVRGMVVVVGMLKGGSGKTTAAVFVGVAFARRGRRVLLLDGDASSQSAYDWSQLAAAGGEPLPFQVERYPFDDITDHLRRVRGDYDVVIVDAGGGSATYLEDAVAAADLLIMPLPPAGADARRIAATLTSATRGAARNTNPDGVSAVAVLVRADQRTGQPRRWRQQIEGDGHNLVQTNIRNLVLYSDAYGHTPPHAGEYEALLVEVDALPEAVST